MANPQYDLVVIGSGPGGYVAAIRGAHNGLKVAIVEKDTKLGGACLLRGCIPTKSLLHSADLLEEIKGAQAHGIIVKEVSVDFSGVQRARQKVVDKSAAGVAYLMKQHKIDVHTGTGRLVDRHSVEVSGANKTVLTAKHIVLATGAVPTKLPVIRIDGKHFVTSDEILELKEPPASLLVLGAGAVGVEFASVYARFGTTVTVVEMLDRPLPNEDADVSEAFLKAFTKRGITVHTSTKLEAASVDNGAVVAKLATAQKAFELRAAMCLVAVGRSPVTDTLGLDQVGVQRDQRGRVRVDAMMKTTVDNIYALGDIVDSPQLAHIASAEALVAVDALSGRKPHALNYLQTPSCTYSDPEVASVGLSEAAAKQRGYNVKVGKFPFSALGKARIMGKSEGFVKIVADARYGEILGVHIIGPRATDLIAEACVALRTECTVEELAHTIHAHPTLPEAVLEASHATLGRPLHM